MRALPGRAKALLRRWLKAGCCALLLAPYYRLCCLRPVQQNLVVFADGHQDAMPYSMEALHARLTALPELEVVDYFHDCSFCTPLQGLKTMLRFMPLYARARYVFLCDCFVPAASCRKRRGTTVVQLWHSCGLLKKAGVDSPEDAAGMMKGQYRNTDVFTASGPAVADILSKALLIPRAAFSSAGVTRMDLLYDGARTAALRRGFLERYPQYQGKALVLWAPTFRGSVRSGYLAGTAEILRLREELEDSHGVILKTHRFGGGRAADTPVDLPSEQLLAIADILITDYSSIYYDYLYFRRPVVFYVPDLEEYRRRRGMYVDVSQLPGRLARNYDELKYAVLHAGVWADDAYRARQDRLWQEQMGDCDGHSCDKLMEELGIRAPASPLPGRQKETGG